MYVRPHPNQDGYIITFPDGIEYATQEGDKYYEMADQLYHNPPIDISPMEIKEEIEEGPEIV